MSDLPETWQTTTIGAVCGLINGKAFKPADWGTTGLPIVRIQNLNRSDASFNSYSGTVEEKFTIEQGQLLFAWSGTPGTSFGAHIWQGQKAVLNQHIFKVIPNDRLVDKEYLKYAINQTLGEQIDKAHGGVGLRHVTKGRFEETKIPVPPLSEQRRIVAKLHTLTGRTARARGELERIPKLIEKFREAILTTAFNGDLTKAWRSRVAREAHTANWTQSTLGTLAQAGPTNGWSPPSTKEGNGALTLKLTASTSGFMRLDAESTKRIYNTPPSDSKFWLRDGDLLIQRGNTIDYVGTAAIYEGPPNTYIYPDLMMRVRFSFPELTRYVWRFINSPAARAYFRSRATGTAGNMPKINGATVRALMIPLPTPTEIIEITSRIDAAFNWLDRVAVEHDNASRLLPKLDVAILAKAFRGELVPQDPNDMPLELSATPAAEARAVVVA